MSPETTRLAADRQQSRPFLVPKEAHSLPTCSPLELWHLLSLDAPTVAAVWTGFLAWAAGLRVPWLDVTAMFLAVWTLYAADRLLDAKPLFTTPSNAELEERHRFHHRHRSAFLGAILSAAIPLVLLLHFTRDAVLHLYVLLASLLGVWLLLVHARPAPSTASHRLPKELAVGLFFPAAVFIPTVARAPVLRPSLAVCALCFATLCTVNCLFLFAWEHPGGGLHAHATTRWAVHYIAPITWISCCLESMAVIAARSDAGVAPMLHVSRLSHGTAPLLACALSSGLLLLLHTCRSRLSPLSLRAMADFVLLTPIPVALGSLLCSHHL